MNKAEQKIRKEFDRLRAEINKIESEKRDAENTALLGRCYRYRNNSGGEEEWWLYMKVLSLAEGGIECFKFQHVEAEYCKRYEVFPREFNMGILGGYEEIEPELFEKEYRQFLASIVELR